MHIEVTTHKFRNAKPVWPVPAATAKTAIEALGATIARWAAANGFKAAAGDVLVVPDAEGGIAGALLGTGADGAPADALAAGSLASKLPAGMWRLEGGMPHMPLAIFAMMAGAYDFSNYRKPARDSLVRIQVPKGVRLDRITDTAQAVWLVRDLINTPASDMGPSALEAAARLLAKGYGAKVTAVRGDALLAKNFPMIHAVGRAAADAPRLIDLRWGKQGAPKLTLVGKGVCFDTGGLDIKPASGMLLMKKDMGGAANVLGLARMIMARGLNVRLRVLIPAVENAIAGNAFRPGDVLKARNGTTVEIGNTDAEGRLVLADALSLAGEEDPDLIVDMATLTGAARVALGPDLPPYYTGSDALAAALDAASAAEADPVWRMPLYAPYAAKLKSQVADTNNVTSDGFAGSVTAALFLQKFVHDPARWMHFDIYGWNPVKKPHAPVGGEAQAIRALDAMLAGRYR